MSDLVPFDFEGRSVRTVTVKDEPLVAGLESHLYVVEFKNGTIKVGVTEQPARRFVQHRTSARNFGTALVQAWVSQPHVAARANEAKLIEVCRAACGIAVEGRRSEYFPLDFDQAVRFAKKLPFKRGDKCAFERKVTAGADFFKALALTGPATKAAPPGGWNAGRGLDPTPSRRSGTS